MIQSKWVFGETESQIAYDIRKKVFVEELGHDEQKHFDEYEKGALHALIGEDDQWLAAGRMYDAKGQFFIGPLAVLPEVRGKNVGDLLVRMLLDKCFQLLADEVYVPARVDVVDFYKKLNFEICGEPYEREPGDMRVLMKVTKANSPLEHNCASCGKCGGK